jgi:predicted phage-related endonuclease
MVGKVTPNTILSASRLPAVMGMSKYRTANDELQVSIGAIAGKTPPDISNEAMDWGNQLEPVILAETAKRLELSDLQLTHEKPYFHESIPLCCSLDGLADGRSQLIKHDPDNGIFVMGAPSIVLDGLGVLEAKLTGNAPEVEPPLWRGAIQLQAQMDIMQAKWGAVATLYQGTKLHIFLFTPHQATLDRIKDVALDFQNRLEIYKNEHRVEAYPAQNSKDADRMYSVASSDSEPLELDDAAAEYARMILEFKAEIDSRSELINQMETQLKELLQDKSVGIAGNYKVSWPMRSYKAQPEKITPAKEAYSVRQSTLTIKELS